MMLMRFKDQNVLYLAVRIGPPDMISFADETRGETRHATWA